MTARHRLPHLVLLGLVVLALHGCADAGGPAAGRPSAPARTPTPTPAPTPTPTPTPTPAPTPAATDLVVVAGGVELTATLRDTPAAAALRALLPLTLRMDDHGGVEKTGRLPGPLPVDDEPDVADPAVGDLGYYAPGQDLVLYHGDQSAYPGIVVLGTLAGDLEALGRISGAVDVEVRAAR